MSKVLKNFGLLVVGLVIGMISMIAVSEQGIAQAQESHRSEFSFSGQSMLHLESPLRFVGDETHSPDLGVS